MQISPRRRANVKARKPAVDLNLGAAEPTLLHEFFERQVILRPNHIAIECNGQSFTYSQLDNEANRIAIFLQSRGVRPGSLVGICMAKSCTLFAAILGVLKAGGGYVPIDPKFPIGRTTAILQDAAVAIVLSDGPRREALVPYVDTEIIDVDKAHNADFFLPFAPIVPEPTDICYVIYTSGSTGAPKGVVLEHRNAVTFVRAMQKVYGLSENDRVYQGFSIAFDASVEEVWAALSLGGTLVVPREDVAQSTTDAAQFITTQRVTFFSTVPSFLALMNADLPSLSLLILGGEPCPPELVERWARPGLRILNTYGPTEATVVATAAECRPGEAVTIGSAMPGYMTYVLDENKVRVAVGECGELYLGGDSIARGYMNRPDLTSDRFVVMSLADIDAGPVRLYRTYDLVRNLEGGLLQFVGRVDSQVKIRGFRVELPEIEAVLLQHPSIQAAAANVVDEDGLHAIATYVVPTESAVALDRESISHMLRDRLPDYMIPKYLDTIEKLPAATSGKIDRKSLPPPQALLNPVKRELAPPVTPMQRRLAEVWEKLLRISPISIDDDFFIDLHGHSLAAGKIATELRTGGLQGIAVRDFYEHRTIQALASHLEIAAGNAMSEDSALSNGAPSKSDRQAPLPLFRWLCVMLQFASLLVFYAVTSAPVVFAVIIILMTVNEAIEWTEAAKISTVVGFAIWPTWLLLSIAIKWIVIGRYKLGSYPVWGFYYFRWWLVTRFQSLSWSQMFIGTPLMSLYFRLMGAKVGKNCVLGTSLCGAFDLIEIGDDTSIGTETHMLGYRVEDGWLIIGNVSIGDNCFVGTHCCLGLNVKMRDGARLDDMSLLADNDVMVEGEGRRGSPALAADVSLPTPIPAKSVPGAGFVFGLFHLALIYAMGYFLILSVAPAIILVSYALYSSGPLLGVAVAFASVPISILWYLQLVILVKRLAIGRIFPGSYSVHSTAYLRYWFTNYLLDNTRHIVLSLYATIFLPRFLRHLGAKIGRMVEISTIMHAMPDLLEISDGAFLADACVIGGQRIYNGTIEIRSNKIGKRTFVGNSAFVPAGVELGNNGLVGVLSTPPAGAHRTEDDTRWLGSPGFALPNTQVMSCFTSRQTFEPSAIVVVLRALVDILRILLPGLILAGVLVLYCTTIVALYAALPLYQVVLLAAPMTLVLSFISMIICAIVKNLLMGRFVPTMKPLWSGYVWFNEVVNALYETVAAATLSPLLGTPFAPAFLRLMGCKIGRWVFMETTLFSEFDLICIGDRAALNLGCTIQPHLFEDRVMKADAISIGSECSVGNMAVVLYSTDMQPRSSLGPLSVLMKGEGLPAATRWYGIPSQPMSVSD